MARAGPPLLKGARGTAGRLGAGFGRFNLAGPAVNGFA